MGGGKELFEGVRRKLIGMRQDLIRESKVEIGQFLNKGDKYSGVSDDGDLADIAFRDLLQAAQATRHRAQLNAVEEALGKMDHGTYGICEDCEGEIPLGRLNIMPFALRCVECQERHELMSQDSEESLFHSSGKSQGGSED